MKKSSEKDQICSVRVVRRQKDMQDLKKLALGRKMFFFDLVSQDNGVPIKKARRWYKTDARFRQMADATMLKAYLRLIEEGLDLSREKRTLTDDEQHSVNIAFRLDSELEYAFPLTATKTLEV